MLDEQISAHFWLSEFLRSDTAVRRGISNDPGVAVLQRIRSVLVPGMERVRQILGVPVQITSGYRSPALNAAVGGSSSSQHIQGMAADFVAPKFGTPQAIARCLVQQQAQLRFDQVIWEGQWVHISFVPGLPRGDVLTAHFDASGRASYSSGVA